MHGGKSMKKIICLLLALTMLAGTLAVISSCESGENETEGKETQGNETTESGDDTSGSSESDSDASDSSESDPEDESDTNPGTVPGNPDEMYDNGGTVSGAGTEWNPTAFAGAEFEINESAAQQISASELLTVMQDRENALTADSVYVVSGVLKLESGTKYYGNYATVIAPDGIVIESASEIVVKELILKGNVTVKDSSDVTFFKLGLVASDNGITVDNASDSIAFKSCRIIATDTAVTADGSNVTLYQSYLSADKGIVSSGDGLSVHSCQVVAKSLGIEAAGKSVIIRSNDVSVDQEGSGIILTGTPYNALVTLNVIENAQVSITVENGYNCVVLLNSAIRIIGEDNINLYVVDNNLGGEIVLNNNKYLLCDGNTFVKDGKSHATVNNGNTEYNGNNLHNVNERVQYGANEELLPHTNKDLFMDMEKTNRVKDSSLTKNYNINKYIRNMAKSGDKVIIPPGYYISPSMLNLGAAHSGTTIYGYGVYHEAADYGTTMQLSQVSNFTVKGMTFGYAKQSSGQIHVLDKPSTNRLLVIGAAGYDKDFGKSNPDVYSTSYTDMFWAGEFTCWKGLGGSYEVIEKNPDGTMLIEITGNEAAKIWTSTGIGDIWCCRMAGANKQSIYLYNCKNFLMKDCVLYGYAAALAITATTIGGNLDLERVHNTVHSPYEITKEEYDFYKQLESDYDVNLEVSIDDQGRYRGSIPRVGSVDATHVNGTTDGISATSCLFESMCDDGSNQRGSSSRLHKIEKNDDGTTTLTYKGTISETYYWLNQSKDYAATASSGTTTSNFRKGDKIFVYASNGKILCDTVALTAAERVGDQKYHMMTVNYTLDGKPVELVYSCYLYSVKVSSDSIEWILDEDGNETDQAVALQGYNLNDNSYKMDHKVLVDNISLNSAGFTFDNVLVQNTRSRGILVKTRDAVVKHCTFRDLAMTGVLLSVETSWGESSVPQNILIEGCLFDKTSGSFGSESTMKYAPIAIEGLGELSSKITVSEDTIPCKNINIIGNKFINNQNNYCITASAAQGIVIRDNVFEGRPNDNNKKFARAIYLNGCMNIDISGNTYSEHTKDDITKAVVAVNYAGLTGTDIGSAFPTDNLKKAE